jgi:hypothetical protein
MQIRGTRINGSKFDICKSVKKKETLWQLLKRLDEEAGQFNMAISEAKSLIKEVPQFSLRDFCINYPSCFYFLD